MEIPSRGCSSPQPSSANSSSSESPSQTEIVHSPSPPPILYLSPPPHLPTHTLPASTTSIALVHPYRTVSSSDTQSLPGSSRQTDPALPHNRNTGGPQDANPGSSHLSNIGWLQEANPGSSQLQDPSVSDETEIANIGWLQEANPGSSQLQDPRVYNEIELANMVWLQEANPGSSQLQDPILSNETDFDLPSTSSSQSFSLPCLVSSSLHFNIPASFTDHITTRSTRSCQSSSSRRTGPSGDRPHYNLPYFTSRRRAGGRRFFESSWRSSEDWEIVGERTSRSTDETSSDQSWGYSISPPPQMSLNIAEHEIIEIHVDDTEHFCAVCHVRATKSCSACKQVYYCSRQHQQQHWISHHKGRCFPYRVETNEVLGRHLVATKTINQGDVILVEKPIVMGPKVISPAVCVACMKRVPETGWVACQSCGWPICSIYCNHLNEHTPECSLMEASGYRAQIIFQEASRAGAFCALVPLRCLLMQINDPINYDTLMSLESHLEERQHSRLQNIYRHNIAGFIRTALKQKQYDEETILKIAAILDTNAFEIRMKDIEGRGIYPTASMMSHDCTPNTKHFFTEQYSIKVIATLPILRGDIISTTYTETLWGTAARRSHLKERKCFDCKCRRCADPTEFHTYVGAILCRVCKETNVENLHPVNEYKMISTNPLDSEAIWKCENCPYTLPSCQVAWENKIIKQALDAVDLSNANALESFLEKYETVLHPNNSNILQAKHALCKIYGNGADYKLQDLPDHLLQRKIVLCEKLLDVAKSLFPGLSTFCGKLLYDLHLALTVQARRDQRDKRESRVVVHDKLKDALKILEEASLCLNHEPDTKMKLKGDISELIIEIDKLAIV